MLRRVVSPFHHREMVVLSRKCCHGCVVTDVLSQKCHPQNRDLPTPSVSRQVLYSVTAIYIVLKAGSVQRYSYLHRSQGRLCTALQLFTESQLSTANQLFTVVHICTVLLRVRTFQSYSSLSITTLYNHTAPFSTTACTALYSMYSSLQGYSLLQHFSS